MKPALRRIPRGERTLQFGVHPRRAVVLTDLTPAARRWVDGLDGTRELPQVLRDAAAAGLDEATARGLLEELTRRGVVHDAATPLGALAALPLAERDRFLPDLDALDLASDGPTGGLGVLTLRRRARVRVYGAGRVGAQVVTLLTASGVGDVRVFDLDPVRPQDLVPGGLTWAELGLTRQEGAVAAALRAVRCPHVADTSDDESPTSRPSTRKELARGVPFPVERLPQAPAQGTRMTRPGNSPERGTSSRQPASLHDQRAPGDGRLRPPSDPPSEPHTQRTAVGSLGVGRTQAPAVSGDRRPQLTRTQRAVVGSPGVGRAQAPVGASGDGGAVQGAGVGGGGPAGGSGGGRKRRGGVAASASAGEGVGVRAGGAHLGDGSQRPDLVILAPVGPLDSVLVNELITLGIPHLLASAFEGYGSVGPLVLPGLTACLHCLDLTRRDRDPDWPLVTARLGGYPAGEIACGSALATAVAACATGHALAFLDGKPPVVTNGTLDVLPDWQWKRRSWAMYEQCRCMRNDFDSLRMVKADSCA